MRAQDLKTAIAERINGLQTARARAVTEFNAFIVRTDARLARLQDLQQRIDNLSLPNALDALEAAGIDVSIGKDR
jgi:hypothetical protein